MDIYKECRVLIRYITGSFPEEKVIELFAKSTALLPLLKGKEARLWDTCIKNPFILPLIDAGMAWRKPTSAFRQRVLHHFVIAESIPGYSHLFLPQKKSKLFIFSIFFRGGVAAFKTLLGSLLLVVLL